MPAAARLGRQVAATASIAASHWRSSSAIESAGHGYQVKLTAVPPGPSPGLPDIVTSLRTPSSAASRMVDADERHVPVAAPRDGVARPSS